MWIHTSPDHWSARIQHQQRLGEALCWQQHRLGHDCCCKGEKMVFEVRIDQVVWSCTGVSPTRAHIAALTQPTPRSATSPSSTCCHDTTTPCGWMWVWVAEAQRSTKNLKIYKWNKIYINQFRPIYVCRTDDLRLVRKEEELRSGEKPIIFCFYFELFFLLLLRYLLSVYVFLLLHRVEADWLAGWLADYLLHGVLCALAIFCMFFGLFHGFVFWKHDDFSGALSAISEHGNNKRGEKRRKSWCTESRLSFLKV